MAKKALQKHLFACRTHTHRAAQRIAKDMRFFFSLLFIYFLLFVFFVLQVFVFNFYRKFQLQACNWPAFTRRSAFYTHSATHTHASHTYILRGGVCVQALCLNASVSVCFCVSVSHQNLAATTWWPIEFRMFATPRKLNN